MSEKRPLPREFTGQTAEPARANVGRVTDETVQYTSGVGTLAEASRATERAGAYGAVARHRADDYGALVRRQAEHAWQSFGQVLYDHPLLLATLGLAIGAAIGAVLPRTRREGESVSDYQDELVYQVHRTRRALLAQAQHGAELLVEVLWTEKDLRVFFEDMARITHSKVDDLRSLALVGNLDPAADFCGADMRGADLRQQNLSEFNLSGSDLRGADLSQADLSKALLTDARLTHAKLTEANLEYADLTGADLYGAKLVGANLRSAVFQCADLRSTDFWRADLTDAIFGENDVDGSNLSRVRGSVDDAEA